jgi:hypothetical protein
MMPAAISIMLPRIAKSLNSPSIRPPFSVGALSGCPGEPFRDCRESGRFLLPPHTS